MATADRAHRESTLGLPDSRVRAFIFQDVLLYRIYQDKLPMLVDF